MRDRSGPRRGRKSRSPANGRKSASPGPNGGNGAARGAAPATTGAGASNGASNGGGGNGLAQRDLARETVKGAPEVREELVVRYRQVVAEGRYDPDLEGVAERMIHEGLLKDL